MKPSAFHKRQAYQETMSEVIHGSYNPPAAHLRLWLIY